MKFRDRTIEAACIALAMISVITHINGCINGHLSPVAATIVEGLFDAACPAEAALPVVGIGAVAACPGEEAYLATILTAAEGPPMPSPPHMTVPLFRPARAGEKPAAVVGGRPLAHAGWAAPGPQAAIVQAACMGAVLPVPWRAPSPAVDGGAADAGKDGGPP